MSSGTLHLKVVTPTRVVVEADVDEVSLQGALGVLGILPGHAPLLAALRIGELSYHVAAGGTKRLAAEAGFVEVANDLVTVLVDGAQRPEEIDVDQARADRTTAEEALRTAADEAFEKARAALDLATTRLAVAGGR